MIPKDSIWYKISTVCFWLLSLTWGCLLTIPGLLSAIILILFGYKPHVFAGRYIYFVFDNNQYWGFNLGTVFFVCKNVASDGELMCHEAGHGVQNILYGVFTPFIVTIPSIIRFQYREWIGRHYPEKYTRLPPYNSIWFEAQATDCGLYLYCDKT